MNQLPWEVLEVVFCQLPLVELFMCCRLVCKRWNDIIMRKKVRKGFMCSCFCWFVVTYCHHTHTPSFLRFCCCFTATRPPNKGGERSYISLAWSGLQLWTDSPLCPPRLLNTHTHTHTHTQAHASTHTHSRRACTHTICVPTPIIQTRFSLIK